jgi:DNA-binding NarL/FixJ family response regulator
VQVPIANEDEIGQVTQTFNQMVAAVRDVEAVLEAEVAKRTQELAESQRRLGAVEERERIGREIHDDLGQIMGYIQVQGEAAAARLRQDEPERAQTILMEMSAVAQEAHERVRQYILGIRTGQASRPVDFWAALHAYLDLARERYDLLIELTADPALRADWRLTPAVETQLLRIVQEGITNVHKHAHATLVQIIFMLDGNWLTMILKDNGRGFDATETTPVAGEHFGLKIMQERAESVNGRWQISSTPGQGTQIYLQLPCARPAITDEPTYAWRVMLVDDHALFREGLGNMLRPYGLQIVGTATNGREAEAQVAELQPDLILMDINMPEQDGLETTRRLKKRFPHLKIVMLTMAEDEAALLQALQYGASGYLLKNLPAAQFLSLLEDVMAGKTIIAPSLATQALTAMTQRENPVAGAPADDPLTPRQQEVLACLAQGMSNKQIADQLVISEKTVKYHVGQMLKRLDMETRYELIVYKLDQE